MHTSLHLRRIVLLGVLLAAQAAGADELAASAPLPASAVAPASAVVPASAVAAEPPKPGAAPTPELQLPVVTSLLEEADTPRNYWSDRFSRFANDIDRFFGDPRYFQEANKSVLQINIAKVLQPGGDGTAVLDGQAKFELPATERRFSLMLESNPEKNLTGDTGKPRPVLTNDVTTSNNQSAAIRYEKPPEESPWHYSADIGVKAHIPLDPFARTRVSYALPIGFWRMKIAQSVFWFASIGLGETTQIDFERFISEPWLFRATSTATWMNDPHNFDLRQDFSLYHTVSDRTSVLYQASVIGASQPELIATEYVLLMLYRYRLHKSWVFVEASPQLHFPKAKNFETSPMLLLRMEFLFDGSR
ncbi:MAG TPA: hypothetical protein VFR06_08625 [Gallionellaceae bacterium]|nr:hypothetical protein [Gallionellaceae bacterium]